MLSIPFLQFLPSRPCPPLQVLRLGNLGEFLRPPSGSRQSQLPNAFSALGMKMHLWLLLRLVRWSHYAVGLSVCPSNKSTKMHPAQEVVRSVREGMLHNMPLCFEISGGTCLHASMASPLIVHISRLYDLRELQDRLVGKLGAAGSIAHPPLELWWHWCNWYCSLTTSVPWRADLPVDGWHRSRRDEHVHAGLWTDCSWTHQGKEKSDDMLVGRTFCVFFCIIGIS